MTHSPPTEAPEFRGRTLTPVSPKPVHFPQASNVPILEKSMEPNFSESAAQMLAQSSAYQSQQQDQPSSDPSSSGSITYTDPAVANNGYSGIGGAAFQANGQDDYASSLAFDGDGQNNQDTATNQYYPHTQFYTTDASSEAASASQQTYRAPDPMSYNPFAGSPGAGAFAQQPPNHNGFQRLSQDYAPNSTLGDGAGGGVNIQTLLDNLASSTPQAPPPGVSGNSSSPHLPHASQSFSSSHTAPPPSSATLPGNPNLPPRPPPQEKPATHPNYAPGDDIRSYHPHSQKNPGAAYRSQTGLPPLLTAGANGLPPPPAPSFQQSTPISATKRTQSPATPNQRQRDPLQRRDGEDLDDADTPWGPEVQKIFDEFLQDERNYVTEGQWNKFPPNSRLFIGNLPTEKVTKRDLFHVFHKYGKLAQISIKQAYGFVQFLDGGAAYQALQNEQGATVRGRKMHLEISKPQRNTRNADGQNKNNANNRDGARKRSRSPDYTRGGNNQQQQRGIDRYTSGSHGGSQRDSYRSRDDYRPRRSPSPRGFHGGRGRDRSPDRYDGRRRSRSRSPYGRSRFRSPSPRRETDDDLPLPRRRPENVPDVQVIVLDDLDRNFIAYVERSFVDAGLKCDVLLLSSRLPEAAVVRRQILEGVQAVTKLRNVHQTTGKIPLQVFDRRDGVDNVRFEEYENLEPSICAQLVLRAKQTHGAPQPQQPAYGMPSAAYGMPPVQYGLPPPQPPPQQYLPPQHLPAAMGNPSLSNTIANLDPSSLQQLLGAMQHQPSQAPQQPPQQPHQQAPPPALTADLARILGGAAPAPQHQTPAYNQPPQQMQGNPYGTLAGNPALASLLGGVGTPQQQAPQQQAPPQPPPQGQQQGQPDMQEIMAQLAKYRR
ncbi:nuclear polyadenylated RNA-binding protein 3 [Coniosporium apollinis]|uniref:Nuclear polyadenylated RNA-binding protein 3 n=1 Tax=Coniosporium apollinis TaxID=61459 RepID=A0ABQ9NW26_9PEZI|nr:nuclear polyadenylated RNA-binding protein 3 [Coniosporium apollinis]